MWRLQLQRAERSHPPLPANLLGALVVEGRAEQVVEQQEGPPPHLRPLVAVVQLGLAEKSKAATERDE